MQGGQSERRAAAKQTVKENRIERGEFGVNAPEYPPIHVHLLVLGSCLVSLSSPLKQDLQASTTVLVLYFHDNITLGHVVISETFRFIVIKSLIH